MKKRGVNKKFVWVFVLAVLVLSSFLVIYINGNITGYDSKKTSTTAAPSTPSTTTTTTDKKGEATSGGMGGVEKKPEVKTVVDEKSNEIQIITVQTEGQTQQKIEVRNVGAVSELELKKTNGGVTVKLSDGEKEYIGIFPNTASRIALSELKAKEKSLNLEEVDEKEGKKAVYVSEASKTTKVLNLFNVKYKSKAEIDAKSGKVTKTEKPFWTFLGKDKEKEEIEDMGLQLIKPIQDIVIIKNKREKLDLDEYFLNAKSYSVSEAENFDLKINAKKLTITPEKDYTGTSSVAITAHNKEESLEVSFNVIVIEKNLTIQTIQYPAMINEKVKWEKKIKADAGEKVRVDIPVDSEQVSLLELDENNNIIDNQTISGDFVNLDSDEGVDSYTISYYTPAPTISEKPTEKGKEITVYGLKNVHYTEVLAFNYIQEAYSVNLYRITEKGREKVELERYDLNGNGFIDYIRWIVPSLSEQTYELIIEAISAEHLDSNRTFISDIYSEVKSLDGLWSETIPENDYVRVTFRLPLDSTRDITIYPKILSGAPYIQVFENNESYVIAESEILDSERFNKILLRNLEGSQETFDLKVLGGEIQIDYIVDPATAALDFPLDNSYLNSQEVIFNCSATDDYMLSNITLYGNWTGAWHANETKEVTGVINSSGFTKTIPDGTYIWNCLVYNNESASAWFANNYTFTVDTTLPVVAITYPLNTSYNSDVSYFNYSYTEINPSKCWYSTNSGMANSSAETCDLSFSSMTSSEGSNTWIFYMNDSAGNLNSSQITFVVDKTAPVVSFSCDKTEVYAGEEITCSCSASDAIFPDLNVVYESHPSTSDTGEFVVVCSAEDNVGNTASSQFTYKVSVIGKPIESAVKTHILTEEMLEMGYTAVIGTKERLKMQINNEEHYLGIISLTWGTATIEISSAPKQIELDVGEEMKLDLTDDGIYDLFVKLNSIESNKVSITVQSISESGEAKEKAGLDIKLIVWIAILLAVLIFVFFVIKKKLYKKFFIFKKR